MAWLPLFPPAAAGGIESAGSFVGTCQGEITQSDNDPSVECGNACRQGDVDTEEPVEAVPSAAPAGDADDRRPLVYLTREDRREAGLRHEILPWLVVGGLLESEWTDERLEPSEDGPRSRDRELANAVQIGAEITPSDWSKLELIYEYEDDDEHNRHILDEAVISLEFGDFEWEGGRIYVPFGEYFSHLVEGPMLEFAETRADGMNLSWSPDESLDLKLYAYRGEAHRDGAPSDGIDGGFAVEVSPAGFGTLGLSYITDLADAEDSVIGRDELPYSNKVDGLSGYAVVGLGDFEFNVEMVRALESFADLDGDRDRPFAWNAEVAWYPSDRYEFAIRIEGTEEMEDEPEIRSGIGAAFWIGRHAVLRLEYLYGSFKSGLAEDDLERELNAMQVIAGQFSMEF